MAKRLLVMLVSTLVSAVGWWLGAKVGIMTAFLTSIVGLAVGVWWGQKLAREWMP